MDTKTRKKMQAKKVSKKKNKNKTLIFCIV